MDCLPTDDLCNLQQDYIEYVESIKSPKVEISELGEFNGRRFTFAVVDGKPIIYIISVKDKDKLFPEILED